MNTLNEQEEIKHQDYQACSTVNNIKSYELVRAYEVCRNAPSALLEMGCAQVHTSRLALPTAA